MDRRGGRERAWEAEKIRCSERFGNRRLKREGGGFDCSENKPLERKWKKLIEKKKQSVFKVAVVRLWNQPSSIATGRLGVVTPGGGRCKCEL